MSDDIRDRFSRSATSDEKFEIIVDILADLKRDVGEIKSTQITMADDLKTWKEIYTTVILGKKILTGLAVVITALAAIGGGIIWIINAAVRKTP